MAHNTLKTRLGLAALGLISCASSALAATYTYRQPANGVVAASAPAPRSSAGHSRGCSVPDWRLTPDDQPVSRRCFLSDIES